MIRCHYFHKDTGVLSARKVMINSPHEEADAALNAPADHIPVYGELDHTRQRIDPVTRRIIDFQPPAPDEHHAWHAESKQWLLNPEAGEKRHRNLNARRRLRELEEKQHRATREALIELLPLTVIVDGKEVPHPVRQRFAEIDKQLKALRADVT